MVEAEEYFQEALTIRKDLAKINPSAYLPYVATTLISLGSLYHRTQHLAKAEEHYQEALTIHRDLANHRDLAKINPRTYQSDLVKALGKIAVLYFKQEQFKQAHQYFSETFPIYRELWKIHPKLYKGDFSSVLILGAITLAFSRGERKETCALLTEAFQVTDSEATKLYIKDLKQKVSCE